tara:strand:+ start:595 stop:1668 length:1074 start_codon:yes stop_codon:yes gene_type:complete
VVQPEYEGKRVWILGAGFSRHLGAPLFHELFSPEMEMLVAAEYPRQSGFERLHEGLSQVGREYARGSGQLVLESKPVPAAWQDPEKYLEVLSGWAENPESAFAPYRENAGPGFWSRLLAASLRRLAAEVTCCYSNGRAINGERGLAYQQWASGLEVGKDVIVSFNYDTIVESLNISGLFTLLGAPSLTDERSFQGKVPLLKMHGSVDWKRVNGAIQQCGIDETIGDDRQFDEFAMAIPGTGKLGFSQANQWLWNCAEQFIQGAEFINFVGYRIPETDGLALNSICKSIRRRCESSKRIDLPVINIVLGPVPTPERARAEGLMRLLLGEVASAKQWIKKVHVHDMWAQDFFQVGGTLR